MRNRSVLAIAVSLILNLGVFLPLVSGQTEESLRKDLEGVYERFNAAIVAKDIKAVMDFYDPKFTLQVEDESIGRDEVESIWKGQFSQMEYAFSKTTISKISVLRTGFVIAEVKWEYKATETNNGKKSLWEVISKSTEIWGKSSGGQWRLINKEDGGSEGKIDGKPIRNPDF